MDATPAGPLSPIFLADATWFGTLAAVRDLGSRGVPVTLGVDRLFAPARWSRHLKRALRCPPTRKPAELLKWLLEFGAREPGHVLYPTSDDLAWLIAVNQEALAPHFRLYTPPADGLAHLLDKLQLAEAARKAGLEVPDTRCPRDEAEVVRAAEELRFPVLLKPRTQALQRAGGLKVLRVEKPADLLPRWRALRASLAFEPMIAERIPDLDLPVVQVETEAESSIYTVDGFLDETGEIHASLACRKILQQPRGSGAGVCFDEAPLDAAAEEGLRRLLRQVGFRGVFDAEFLVQGDRHLLIDLNPRFYNHMAFEVERGLPLPWMAYLAATGDRETLQKVRDSAAAAGEGKRAYLHRLPTALMVGVQTVTGGMGRAERQRLRRWRRERAGRITDPVRVPGDGRPAVAEVAMNLAACARHPRAYLRALAARVPPRAGAKPGLSFDGFPPILETRPGDPTQIQTLWFTLARRRPQSVALVAVEPGVPVGPLALSLADVGQRLIDLPVAAVVASPCDYAFVTRTTGLLAALPQGGKKRRNVSPLELIIAMAPVTVEPLGLGVIQAVDAVVLCFALGHTSIDAARQAVERIGRDRIIGCVAVEKPA